MKKLYFILWTALLWVSCSNEKSANDSVRLVATDNQLRLPIDSKIKLYTFAMHHFEDTTGVEYLSIEDNTAYPDYLLSFYRLDSCKLSHTVKIRRKGPDAVIAMMGHGVLGLDEIIVSSAARPMLYKINRNGHVLHTYEFSQDQNGMHSVSLFNSLIYTPLICCEGKIYATQTLPYSRFMGDNYGNAFEFNKSPVSLVIDTATGKFYNPAMTYPVLFKKDKMVGKNENFSRIFDGKRFVYSFSALSSIYVSDDMNTARAIPAESRYIGPLTYNGFKEGTDNMKSALMSNTAARYGNILYDKYRDVYYRFCFFKDDIKTMPREYLWCHGAFTVMILDNNFNVIGETVFERGRYAPMLFFVNRDGLWLSENNYERDDMNDDELVFRCLKLECN